METFGNKLESVLKDREDIDRIICELESLMRQSRTWMVHQIISDVIYEVKM